MGAVCIDTLLECYNHRIILRNMAGWNRVEHDFCTKSLYAYTTDATYIQPRISSLFPNKQSQSLLRWVRPGTLMGKSLVAKHILFTESPGIVLCHCVCVWGVY